MANELSMYSGDNKTIRVTVTSGGAALDLTTYTARFVVRRRFTDPGATITKSSGAPSELSITDPVNGVLEVYLLPADTEAIEGDYYYDVEITSPAGIVSTVVQSTLTINPDVAQ